MVVSPKLHVVAGPEKPRRTADELGTDGDVGDLVLLAALFGISFFPVAGALAHVGHWGTGTLGLGTAGSLLAGRELWAAARAALRGRR